MIGRIETEVERNGKTEYETRYYLCSLALCALSFARVVRAHWGVENRLHWVLDVVFREDLARFRTGDGPQNMAIIRHTALNLLSGAGAPHGQSEEPAETRWLERRLPRNRHPADRVMFRAIRLNLFHPSLMPRPSATPHAPARAIIARTPGKPAKCQAMAPPATPMLPARKVQALMIPEPCPSLLPVIGRRAPVVVRAPAYGNAGPAHHGDKPDLHQANSDTQTQRMPMMALAMTISPMHPIMAQDAARRVPSPPKPRGRARTALCSVAAAPHPTAVRSVPIGPHSGRRD